MGGADPPDPEGAPAQSPNHLRAEQFGGPILTRNAGFATSGFFSKRCRLSDAEGTLATVRRDDVRLRDGTGLRFETFRTGGRPRHGRTVLVDAKGKTRASAEWSAEEQYFRVQGNECSYTVDRADRRHHWRIEADGVVAEFDHHSIEVFDPVPVVAVLLAWRVARTLEHLPGFARRATGAWDRRDRILGS